LVEEEGEFAVGGKEKKTGSEKVGPKKLCEKNGPNRPSFLGCKKFMN
jgi:hypothetical protein